MSSLLIAVINDASQRETLPNAVGYFKNESARCSIEMCAKLTDAPCRFELDYSLANLKKPYICILNGNTSEYLSHRSA